MKKFIIPFIALSFYLSATSAANADDTSKSERRPMKNSEKVNPDMENTDRNDSPKQGMNQQNEGRRGMMKRHHEMMEKLTPEQKAAVKQEMERHRAEMKKITGFSDEMFPPKPDSSDRPKMGKPEEGDEKQVKSQPKNKNQERKNPNSSKEVNPE